MLADAGPSCIAEHTLYTCMRSTQGLVLPVVLEQSKNVYPVGCGED